MASVKRPKRQRGARLAQPFDTTFKDWIRFRQLELYALEAERYVLEQAYCMYPLLPAMQGADHRLLKRAMDELAALHGDNEATLAQQYVWMQILLERTETIDLDEKERIHEAMQIYDPLWKNHPKVKKIVAESIAEGLARGQAEGLAEGQAKGLAEGQAKGQAEGRLVEGRKMLITVVSALFPKLGDLADQAARRITSPDQLELLIEQIVKATDEQTARWLLTLLVP